VLDRLNLELGSATGTVVEHELFDATGRSISAGRLNVDASGVTQIDVQGLPPGTYLLMVRTAAGRTWTRVVKA
jgi:hypothetical protein